jgi:hypothetical protein
MTTSSGNNKQDDDDVYILASMRPEDANEAVDWAREMIRMQIAVWVFDKRGTRCAHCKKPYDSVDDFLARRPKKGFGDGWHNFFVDAACWDEYSKAQGRNV